MIPVSLDLEGPDVALITTVLTASNLGLGMAAWLNAQEDFDPTQTWIAQLGGLGGGVLGSLFTMLATGEELAITRGAVIGSMAGIGVGALVTAKTDLGSGFSERQGTGRLASMDLPGDWTVQLSPTVLEDGEMGTWIGLSATGL
jgi:hypothetical protein